MRARCCLLALIMTLPMRAETKVEADGRECVVLLHGVALSGWAMRPLARALEQAGYRTLVVSYPSRSMGIDALADEFLPAQLAAGRADAAPRVHFVAHSMGGLIVRAFLRDRRPENLGRVVMLGTPNHGSPAADAALRSAALRGIVGTNLAALGTGTDAAVRRLGQADFELGIIAGTSRVNPLFAKVMPGEHDGVVTLESAQLEGMSDFLVVPHSHTVMLWRREVIGQVVNFLRDGSFRRDAEPKPDAAKGR